MKIPISILPFQCFQSMGIMMIQQEYVVISFQTLQEGRLAALDLLSVCNMVNYFGKSDNIDDVTVYPILMKKGSTKIAIYGLGNIRDERLYRTFQQKKVRLMRPVEAKDEWFNIFVMHQNRVAHNPKNYIHENMLDAFLDFVIWGHEHECHIIPQPSTVGQFYITQPGSSVATALSEGEAKKKYGKHFYV